MTRYYAIDDANTRLEELRPLLEALRDDRESVAQAQEDLARFRRSNGTDEHAQELAEKERRVREIVKRMQAAVARIDGWGITLRDIPSGLVDFPALASGRPIWLCWRIGEGDIAWWHELSEGLAGRQPLVNLV